MNDREFDIKLVEKMLKIDEIFEKFLMEKLGSRGNAKRQAQGAAEDQPAAGTQRAVGAQSTY